MTDVYDGAVSIRDKLGRLLSGEALHVARPLISVITPTRNRLELLSRTLESLVHQENISPKMFEVIVVVDGSYDGTAGSLRQRTFPFRLKVIEQVRAGVAVARNAGWRAAAAELVLFLDDDMIASPGLLTQHVNAHRDQPGSVVIGRFSPDSSVRRTAWTRYDELAQEKKYASLGRTEEPSGIRLYTGNVSMPRAALDATGGFDSTLPRNEDVDLGFRLQRIGYKFCYKAAANSLHCGYRDFDGWRTMPLLYGRLDVAMYRDRGFAGGLETIVACFHDRHPLNRIAIRVAVGHAGLARAELRLFAWLGLTAHKLHLERISYLSLSAVWNILYWTGVRDGLRGNEPFRRMLRGTRRRTQRPYRRVSVSSPH
jgi:glycosyltransferase involved in cell wall biosynthesis